MDDGREGIPDELEMPALPAEGDTADVQCTLANIADADGLLRDPAVDLAEVRRPGDGEFARKRPAGDGDEVRPGWVRAVDRDRGRVGAGSGWLEADRDGQRATAADDERVGENARNQEFGGRRAKGRHGEGTVPGVAQCQRLIGEVARADVAEVTLAGYDRAERTGARPGGYPEVECRGDRVVVWSPSRYRLEWWGRT